MHFSFDDIGSQLAGFNDVLKDFSPVENTADVFCPNCGFALDDFLDTGYVGCAECYKAFREYALKLAKNTHGRLDHVGKSPKGETTKNLKIRELERLEGEKERAVKNEDYIAAADLKKKIDKLRGELK